ncbi:uncharacterized protein A4U43_C09F3350 [Asparagus officinalis]|uniref:Uncharacterized protein n=1 Tax=Asparagus officinalis TaxID=4686 RepID=A0A5P1E9S3_ASPOF|nr:uncharacterized protein A4U43_C09F3350 [Asparagus officinalis]
MLTAGATYEVPESPAKKPESTSEESEEDDDDSYGDGLHEMTDQERAMYAEAVRRSDGFDVPPLPNVFAIGIIQPVGSDWPAEDIREIADFAMEDQNEKRKKEVLLLLLLLLLPPPPLKNIK